MLLNKLAPKLDYTPVKYAVYGPINVANDWFNHSTAMQQEDVFPYLATEETTPSKAFNQLKQQILEHLNGQSAWVVFTHAHLIFIEDLSVALFHADSKTVYGLAGSHAANAGVVFCSITTKDDQLVGMQGSQLLLTSISDDCIIIHTDLLPQIEFDEQLKGHLLFSDITLWCKANNISVRLLHTKVNGPGIFAYDVNSENFTNDRNVVFQKWQQKYDIVHTFYGWFSGKPNAQYIVDTDMTGRSY